MYYVYIIYSGKRDRYYVGSCGDIEARLRRHNTNHRGYTGGVGDWALVYSESYADKSAAQFREREIKRWKSRKRIEELIAAGA